MNNHGIHRCNVSQVEVSSQFLAQSCDQLKLALDDLAVRAPSRAVGVVLCARKILMPSIIAALKNRTREMGFDPSKLAFFSFGFHAKDVKSFNEFSEARCRQDGHLVTSFARLVRIRMWSERSETTYAISAAFPLILRGIRHEKESVSYHPSLHDVFEIMEGEKFLYRKDTNRAALGKRVIHDYQERVDLDLKRIETTAFPEYPLFETETVGFVESLTDRPAWIRADVWMERYQQNTKREMYGPMNFIAEISTHLFKSCSRVYIMGNIRKRHDGDIPVPWDVVEKGDYCDFLSFERDVAVSERVKHCKSWEFENAKTCVTFSVYKLPVGGQLDTIPEFSRFLGHEQCTKIMSVERYVLWRKIQREVPTSGALDNVFPFGRFFDVFDRAINRTLVGIDDGCDASVGIILDRHSVVSFTEDFNVSPRRKPRLAALIKGTRLRRPVEKEMDEVADKITKYLERESSILNLKTGNDCAKRQGAVTDFGTKYYSSYLAAISSLQNPPLVPASLGFKTTKNLKEYINRNFDHPVQLDLDDTCTWPDTLPENTVPVSTASTSMTTNSPD